MATANDLIRRAYQLVNVVGLTDTPSGEQYDAGLESLNEMLDTWREWEDIDLGLYSVTTATTIPAQYFRPLRYNLAMELATETAVQVDPNVPRQANAMKADLKDPDWPELQIDETLLAARRFDINSGR